MNDHINISKLIHELNRRAARAVVSQLSFRSIVASNYLRSLFEKLPGEDGSFMTDPVFEATFGWRQSDKKMKDLKNKPLSEAVLEALSNPPKNPEDLSENYEFPLDRHPYEHQLASWETLLAEEKKSVLVSSGTGSGKTECFLVPILEDLYKEYEELDDPLTGVRALFLYPLNALINSQRERLKAWTNHFEGGLRFCLYNGETPTKRTKASVMKKSPEEVCDRTILRENPSPILVTNSTMLEYMLIRNEDAPIIEQSQGKLRWIVLDEAHTYIGSQAAELALLLRRVIDAFGVKAEDVRFIATSATIGGGDKKSLLALQNFLADVAGVDESQVRVITGSRKIPEINESDKKQVLSYKVFSKKSAAEQFELLCGNPPALKIRKKLATAPHAASTKDLIQELKTVWKDMTRQDLWALIDTMATANDGNSAFLPVRGHLFQKTLDGIYACTNASCSHMPDALKDGDWGYGQIYLSERDFCHCGAPVQPILSCNSCGEEYLEAEENFIGEGKYELLQPTRHDDDDEFIWDIEPEDESLSEPEVKKDKPVKETVTLHYKNSDSSTPVRLQNNTREMLHEGGDIILYRQVSNEVTCNTCGAKDRSGWKVFMPKRLGAPFFLGDSLPTLLEHSPKHGEGPFESRRLLTFTDSRQGTARIAARLQQDVDRNKVRSVLYHAVHVPAGNDDDGKAEQLKKDIINLEKAVKSSPFLNDMKKDKQKELEDLSRPSVREVTWSDAEKAINNSRDISRYMFDAFQEISSSYIDKDQFGDFCLLREFMRRPRRGFQLETLGMVEMFYPDIDALSSCPDSWGQLYSNQKDKNNNAINDWKDWLTILIDVYLRENSAVNYPNPDSWRKLMGAKISRKFIVGPRDERDYNVLRWPSAKRSTRSKVVSMLARGFKLDTESATVIDHMEQVFDDSWNAVRSKVLSPQDENRYLLNLKGKAAFRKLNNVWKCPYTLRIVSRLFRGQSPNTPGRDIDALKCSGVVLPDLPFPFETDRANRAKIIDWLETDPLLEKAREMGVWPNRGDRIAAGEPWFRIAEHSAQVDSKELKEYEDKFKDGKINVLSCSTTMEMGVDIGGMSVVAMNNVPPHPANYLQRAGRAGRRNESTSISYTLCKQSAHSMQVFNDPKWPFLPGMIAAPRISLESKNIVQRHVNALLFSFWLREFSDDIPKLTSGWLMEKAEDSKAVIDGFIAWCYSIASQSEYKQLSDSVKAITKKTSIESKTLDQLARQSALIIDAVYLKWWDEFGAMLNELAKVSSKSKRAQQEPAVKAINISLDRMRQEYLLRDLANGGFLPGYGFPTHVVSLNTLTMRELTKSKQKTREDGFGKIRGNPSRDLAVALREYAPGAEIVIKGLVYRSAGITLNWHRPSNLEIAPEIQNLYRHWECNKCGDFGDTRNKLLNCPSCNAGNEKLEIKDVLEPAGFSVDLFVDPHTDVNRPTFMPFEDAKVAAVDATWKSLPNNKLGAIRYSENGLVSHVSSGMYKHCYTLCLCCGRSEPQFEKDKEVVTVSGEHKRLRGGKDSNNSALCEGPGNDYMIRKNLYLASKIHTSVFEFQLRDSRNNYKPVKDQTIAWTIGFALRNALTSHLGVDQREVEVAVRDMQFEDETKGFSLCLYDTASQGAGYVEVMQNDLIYLLKKARKRLICPVSCDSVCKHCLLDNSSQFKEKHLNREVAADWLDDWLKSCVIPDELKYFGNNSSVNLSTLPYQLELLIREQKVDRVCFFLEISEEDPATLAYWPMLDVTQRMIASGIDIEWILTGNDLGSWRNRCGSQLAALLEVYDSKLYISHMSAQNIISETGKMIMSVTTGERGRYWAGENAVLNLMEDWGVVDGPIITTLEWIKRMDFPVNQLTNDDLKPVVNNTSASIKLRKELDGRTFEFGKRFIKWVNKEIPILAKKFDSNNKLQNLTYSDRYLRSPIHLVLLQHLIKSILNTCGDNNTAVTVITTIMPCSNKRPFKLFHNFVDSNDRDETLSGVLSNITENSSIDVASHNSQTSHARTLTLHFSDGDIFEIGFDQGMGAWRYSGNSSWDNYADTASKVDAIVDDAGSICISGKWGTLVNIRKAK